MIFRVCVSVTLLRFYCAFHCCSYFMAVFIQICFKQYIWNRLPCGNYGNCLQFSWIQRFSFLFCIDRKWCAITKIINVHFIFTLLVLSTRQATNISGFVRHLGWSSALSKLCSAWKSFIEMTCVQCVGYHVQILLFWIVNLKII